VKDNLFLVSKLTIALSDGDLLERMSGEVDKIGV
jgi:hypothetical protein